MTDIVVVAIEMEEILEVGGSTDTLLVSTIIPLILVAVGGPIVMSNVASISEQFPSRPQTHKVLPSSVLEHGLIKL